MRTGAKSPRLLSTAPDEYPKRRPIGIYDKTILCGDCENLFQTVDDYAPSFFLSEHEELNPIVDPSGKKVAYQIDNVDNEKIKLFILSVLWRASVSSETFFAHINLGPYEPNLRDRVQRGDTGDDSDFPLVLSRFNDSTSERILNVPHSRRIDGVRFYTLYLASYVAEIKVDKQPLPEFLRQTALKKVGPIWIFYADFASSNALEIAKTVVKSQVDKSRS